MAGRPGSGTEMGMLRIGEVARLLGVSTDTIRHRERDGLMPSVRLKGRGHRYYRTADVERWKSERVAALRPPGKTSATPDSGIANLTHEQEEECLRIAEAVATEACAKWKALDRDEAISDATLGVAKALRRLSADIPWNVSCYNHARWEVLKGLRARGGVSSREYDRGLRYEDLPQQRRVPVSLEGQLTDSAYDHRHQPDFADQAALRVDLEDWLQDLPRVERIALVNTCAHLFTDREVAEGLGLTVDEVRVAKERAREVWNRSA